MECMPAGSSQKIISASWHRPVEHVGAVVCHTRLQGDASKTLNFLCNDTFHVPTQLREPAVNTMSEIWWILGLLTGEEHEIWWTREHNTLISSASQSVSSLSVWLPPVSLHPLRKRQLQFLLEGRGRRAGLSPEELRDNGKLLGEGLSRALFNYPSRDCNADSPEVGYLSLLLCKVVNKPVWVTGKLKKCVKSTSPVRQRCLTQPCYTHNKPMSLSLTNEGR